jgi:hypothetical protein
MHAGNSLLLPDSRCSSDVGSILVDRQLLDGSVVRQEFVPIFCASCGKEFNHKPIDGIPAGCVPKDSVSFVCWLCPPCFEKHGAVAGTYAVPEDEFNQNLQAEMRARVRPRFDRRRINHPGRSR